MADIEKKYSIINIWTYILTLLFALATLVLLPFTLGTGSWAYGIPCMISLLLQVPLWIINKALKSHLEKTAIQQRNELFLQASDNNFSIQIDLSMQCSMFFNLEDKKFRVVTEDIQTYSFEDVSFVDFDNNKLIIYFKKSQPQLRLFYNFGNGIKNRIMRIFAPYIDKNIDRKSGKNQSYEDIIHCKFCDCKNGIKDKTCSQCGAILD